MDLREYVARRIDKENSNVKSPLLRFDNIEKAEDIVNLYRTFDGMKRHMRALSPEKVNEYMEQGYAFVGAYMDKELAGIAVSKQLPTEYPYFTLPKNESQGDIYTLGGLYVRPDFQGFGIASKLSKIVTKGTEDFGKETGSAVGMAYEVAYDNFGSLSILSKHGNYIGYYADSTGQEGLTILLYKPYEQEAIKVDKPNIVLTSNEQDSLISLTNGLVHMANQEQIGGLSQTKLELDNGSVVTSLVLDKTPLTIPEQTFEMIDG